MLNKRKFNVYWKDGFNTKFGRNSRGISWDQLVREFSMR